MLTTTSTALPQLRFPGQAAAPDGPIDLAAMYLMHRAFRRDLDAFVDMTPSVAPEDRASWSLLADRFDLFASILHKHHHGEDVGLWPLLRERGADPAVLDALEAEHGGIDPALAGVGRSLRALAAGDLAPHVREELTAALSTLRDALGAHLAHEERAGMALVQAHLSPVDWERLDREVFSKDYTAREVPAVLGWVASGLTDEQVRRLPGGGSAVFRFFARLMARRFERREARVFASSAS